MLRCHVCGDPFTRQFSLKRNMKQKHAQSNVESKKENPKIHNFTENGLKLRHPFTMMVAASTGGGRRGLSKIYLKTESIGFPSTTANRMDLWSVATLVCRDAENHTGHRVCERHPSKH